MMDNFSTSIRISKPGLRSDFGIVAAQNRRAAETGAAVLSQGGDAVDAAIATSYAVLYLTDQKGQLATYHTFMVSTSSTHLDVFDGPTFTYEDDRFEYSEHRLVTLGLQDGLVVSIVHTESTRQIRVISFRKAMKHEQAIFFKNL